MLVCGVGIWGLVEGFSTDVRPAQVAVITISLPVERAMPLKKRAEAAPHLALLPPPRSPVVVAPVILVANEDSAPPSVARQPTISRDHRAFAAASVAPPPPDYLSRLAAHLNAFKHYPRAAQMRHEEGTVRLEFTMDRTGKVQNYQIVASSGFPDLDDEARAVIQEAQPLPPVPQSYPGTTLDLVLPLVFSLR